MDIKQKKTALDDDSILYQKRDDSSRKKDLSALSGRQKLQYFKDYYLKFCLLAAVLLVIAGNLIYTIFFRHQETVLNIAAVNDTVIPDVDGLEDCLKDYFITDSKHQSLTVNNYYLEDANQQMAFSTRLVTNDLDLVICDPDTFDSESTAGFYLDLSTFLPSDLLNTFSERLVTGKIVETDENDQIIRTGEVLPYGINIADTALYTTYGGTASDAILCVPAGSKRTDTALTLIRLLVDWTPDTILSPASEAAQEESQ